MKIELKKRNIENGKWFWINNEFIEYYRGYLLSSCFAVYQALCYYANNNTQECFPSKETLAEDSGQTSRTVGTCIKILEELNVVGKSKTEKRWGYWQNNLYYLIHKDQWIKPEEIIAHGSNRKLATYLLENKSRYRKKQIPTNKTYINNTNNTDVASLKNRISSLKNQPGYISKKSKNRDP